MPLPFTFFVKTSTILAAPSDSVAGVHNGRDAIGSAITDGIFTFSTLNLDHNSTGNDFTGGTDDVEAGDYIYVDFNGSGTSVDGLYEIASVTDTDNVVLVADAGLIDDATGVTTAVAPWATIQYAFDNTTTTGQHLVICDDGNGTGTHWEYAITLDIDTNQGGVERISVRGANSRGVVDGTSIVLSGASLAPSTSLVTLTTMDYWSFYDIRFTGATSHCFNGGGTGQGGHTFHRCRFDGAQGASSDGIQFDGGLFEFTECEFDNNGRSGLRSSAGSRSADLLVQRSIIHDNVGSGAQFAQKISFTDCVFYDNGGHGWALDRRVERFAANGCVFFGNANSGIGLTGSMIAGDLPASITNCVFRSNGAWGIDLGTAAERSPEVKHNCFSNNTSGDISTSGGGVVAFPGEAWGVDSNIYVDPEFEDETNGSENFIPAAGSPLIGAGEDRNADGAATGNKDIGALQHTVVAGAAARPHQFWGGSTARVI